MARSEFWQQLQADIYKTPIVVTNAAEGPAYGVALLAGVGTGVWSTVEQACHAAIRHQTRITPNKKRAALYDRHYALYTKLYPALKDLYPTFAALSAI